MENPSFILAFLPVLRSNKTDLKKVLTKKSNTQIYGKACWHFCGFRPLLIVVEKSYEER